MTAVSAELNGVPITSIQEAASGMPMLPEATNPNQQPSINTRFVEIGESGVRGVAELAASVVSFFKPVTWGIGVTAVGIDGGVRSVQSIPDVLGVSNQTGNLETAAYQHDRRAKATRGAIGELARMATIRDELAGISGDLREVRAESIGLHLRSDIVAKLTGWMNRRTTRSMEQALAAFSMQAFEASRVEGVQARLDTRRKSLSDRFRGFLTN